jgi:hypothetical protein
MATIAFGAPSLVRKRRYLAPSALLQWVRLEWR